MDGGWCGRLTAARGAPLPAAQDCGNVLWAFAVLDILTPEVMQARLGDGWLACCMRGAGATACRMDCKPGSPCTPLVQLFASAQPVPTLPRRPPPTAAAGREAAGAAARQLHAGNVHPAVPSQDEPEPAGGWGAAGLPGCGSHGLGRVAATQGPAVPGQPASEWTPWQWEHTRARRPRAHMHAAPAAPQVHAVAAMIPPELLAQAETEWRQQSSVIKVSHTHKCAGGRCCGRGGEARVARRSLEGSICKFAGLGGSPPARVQCACGCTDAVHCIATALCPQGRGGGDAGAAHRL